MRNLPQNLVVRWPLGMAALCLVPILARAQEPTISIIPKPVSMTVTEGAFRLTPETVVVAGDGTAALGRQLAGMLEPATGFDLKVKRSKRAPANAIVLRLDPGLRHLGDEGYRLEVTPQRVRIRAAQPAGIFYAFQTLRQLLPPPIFREARVAGVDWTIPGVTIEDHPRFRWRGMHLDVCRHFMPKEFVKKYIGLRALHKMHAFHWHLTEEQGWRSEIRKYPKLTEVGAWREETLVGSYQDKPWKFDDKRHGGFYTQDDVREIVAYARDRRVRIVPEIEMPGHAQAAIAAYPELGNTGLQLPVRTYWGVNENIFNANEATILFLQDVLAEVLELFPGEFIHVGGDEAVKTQWEETPEARARIRELGLDDADELQSYFIGRMDAFLTENGRRLIGWDEILEGGLAPGATVMSWRGEDGGIAAAKAGHDAVMAPYSHLYFDYAQGDHAAEPLAIGTAITTLAKVYEYDPIPASLTAQEARHILGAQGQLWTEYIPDPKHAEYMAYPRGCALAEIVWTPQEERDFADFSRRLERHVERLAILDVGFRPPDR